MKKKQDGLKNLGVFVVAGLLAGACSPMAPSVSKLSNASAQKTSPTDGSSPSNTVSAASALLSAKAVDDGDASQNALQQTVVQGPYEYKNQDLSRMTRPSMELDKASIDDLTANGTVQFNSNDPRVKGREDALSGVRLDIILAMHAVDAEKLDGLSLDEIHATLKWHSDTSKWELTIVSPNTGDGNEDVTKYNKIRDILRTYLNYVAIEFKVNIR